MPPKLLELIEPIFCIQLALILVLRQVMVIWMDPQGSTFRVTSVTL